MKHREDTYLGFHDSNFYYVAQGISKAKFTEMVQKYSKGGYLSANWIKQRVGFGANEKALEHLKENPGHLLILDKNTHNLIYKH